MTEIDASAHLDEGKIEKEKSLFVISPIGGAGTDERKHADLFFNAIVKPVVARLGYQPIRADQVDKPGIITDHIITSVVDSVVCIVDLSFLNPNVLYELGIRHYVGLPTIHMASKGTALPFDNVGARTIFFDLMDWESQEQARKSLHRSLLEVEKEGYEVSNPVTHAKAMRDIVRSDDPEDQIVFDLMRRVESLENSNHIKNINNKSKGLRYSIDENRLSIDISSANSEISSGIESIVENISPGGLIDFDYLRHVVNNYGFPLDIKHFVSFNAGRDEVRVYIDEDDLILIVGNYDF
ncbi:hypothetical protein [Oceanicaulis sp. UBA2681]|uniref:hypothetical protein n=1 Tax=Oceanicaulis sp. UBA2681 TaxID=1947007 RepID=UPI002352A1DE|nr:hypothetical protein [Oceanicaulis sp. UBA2681]|tara:strand:- start:2416 stop:3303 length:888 start_codon:yes stop_codon:yes gene_type:complete